ncbi:MAG: hypothetical protein HGA27_03025 [Peptococcaceae bacterium]|nr:hypothetical protein [Peptococcaceae bacterium]
MPGISGKFLGYNKQQVETQLEEMNSSQKNQLLLLQENINACFQERNNLLQEKKLLIKQRQTYMEKAIVLEHARKRVNKSLKSIENATEDEISAIDLEKAEKIAFNSKYAVDIEREITSTKNQLEEILKGIIQLGGHQDRIIVKEEESIDKVAGTIFPLISKSRIVSAMKDDVIGKSVVCSNGSLLGKVEKIDNNEVNNEIKGFFLSGGIYILADYVVAVKNDALVISADWQDKNNLLKAETSYEKLENIKKIIEKHCVSDENKKHLTEQRIDSVAEPVGGEESKPSGIHNNDNEESQIPSGSFWDAPATGKLSGGLLPAEENIVYIEPPGSSTETDSALNDNPINSSTVVSREIKTVRHKYIVGKLAGEDLADSKGEIVIRKNEIITPEIIDKSEREGKLAELIVNMIIPGLE